MLLWRRKFAWLLFNCGLYSVRGGCQPLTSPWCTEPCIPASVSVRLSDASSSEEVARVICCVLPLHWAGDCPRPPALTNNYPSLVIGRWLPEQTYADQFPAELSLVRDGTQRPLIGWCWMLSWHQSPRTCAPTFGYDLQLVSLWLLTLPSNTHDLPSSCSSWVMFWFREVDLYLISAPVTIYLNPLSANKTSANAEIFVSMSMCFVPDPPRNETRN